MTETGGPEVDSWEGAPLGRPVRRRAGSRLLWIAAVGIVLLVGTLAALVLFSGAKTPDSGYRAGESFTSSDGTFTMTLPDGWLDQTQDYRDAFAGANDGAASAIEGMVAVDGLPIFASENFVSISGHPLVGVTPSGPTQLEDTLNDWRLLFDDVADLASGQFTTDEGDDVWYGGINGHIDGVEKSIIVAVVMGQDSYALFDLEIRPAFYSAEGDFLEALKSVVFAPVAEVPNADSWWEPHPDGRTYSSDGGASIVVPDTWTHLAYAADEDAVDPRIDFDFLGLWQIGEGNVEDEATVSLVVGVPPVADLTALELLNAQYGGVGETTTDDNGVEYAVDAIGEFSIPGAQDGARVALTANYDATGMDLFEGRVVPRYCYVLLSTNLEVMACVEAPAELIDGAVASTEETLQTLRFEKALS